MRKTWLFVFIISSWLLNFSPANIALASNPAQTPEPKGPIYVVQKDDTLWDIAARFRVSLADLTAANGISEASPLVVGAQLIIPGLEGVQGILMTRTVAFGETLVGISRYYQIPQEILLRLNHLTSPLELYAGSTLVLPELGSETQQINRVMLAPGESLLELAIRSETNPWKLMRENQLSDTWRFLPGDVFQISTPPDQSNEEASISTAIPFSLPNNILSASIEPVRLVQGNVAVVKLSGEGESRLGGELIGHPLNFFPDGSGGYVSLQGIHALTEPGLYQITITGTHTTNTSANAITYGFSQGVLISSGDYPFDPVLTVSPETIDPAVTKPEDAIWSALTATATDKRYWAGEFTTPIPPPLDKCWPSLFGNRRSYNGSDYSFFHTGLDFCGGVGNEILAPAAGKVVFAGPLTVRGNATVIDHGWGVFSAYLHQSEILVQVGEIVSQGQLIGKVGGTGRVTGPHLHWEIWAGGVQVDPLDWLNQAYP